MEFLQTQKLNSLFSEEFNTQYHKMLHTILNILLNQFLIINGTRIFELFYNFYFEFHNSYRKFGTMYRKSTNDLQIIPPIPDLGIHKFRTYL